MDVAVLPLVLWIAPAVASPDSAPRALPLESPVNRWSFAVAGGVQTWTLSGLREVESLRSANFAAVGYAMNAGDAGWAGSVGAEIDYHLGRRWRARVQAEWTRFRIEDRDARYLSGFGEGRELVSIGYETAVTTNPVIATVGLRRVKAADPLVWSGGLGLVLAPVTIEDSVKNWVDATDSAVEQRIRGSGFGVGGEATVTCDWLTESTTSVYAEAFVRLGRTTVVLDEPERASSFTPEKRDVDFTGGGLRVGMRWN